MLADYTRACLKCICMALPMIFVQFLNTTRCTFTIAFVQNLVHFIALRSLSYRSMSMYTTN
jgi:hypothetical protein